MINTYFKNFWPIFDLGIPKGVRIIVDCQILVTRGWGLGQREAGRIRDMVFSQPCWSESETHVVVMVVGRGWQRVQKG